MDTELFEYEVGVRSVPVDLLTVIPDCLEERL
jgi:hypothetical protein